MVAADRGLIALSARHSPAMENIHYQLIIRPMH